MSPEFPVQPDPPRVQRVTLVDLDLPMETMVLFMVKWALATIPALVILTLVGMALLALLAGMGSLL